MRPKTPSLFSTLLSSRHNAEALPLREASCPDARLEAPRVAAFRRLCALQDEAAVPLLYPHLLVTPLHLRLLGAVGARPGVIHLRLRVQRYRHLQLGGAYDLHCRLLAERRTARGLELDIGSELWRDDLLSWQAISTYLCRGQGTEGAAESVSDDSWPELQAPREPCGTWRVPRLTGWRYARLSGDYNLLQLSTLAARAGGLRRPHAPGLWCLARSLAGRRLPERLRLDGRFLAPVFLGAQVRQERRRADGLEQWALLGEGEGAPLMLAQLEDDPSTALR